jgi:hypothetical protein
VDGFHELRGDALAAEVAQHPIEPGEEHTRLQLETEEEADRPLLDARHHLQHVMAAEVAPVEELCILGGAEDLVVEVNNLRQVLRTDNIDNCVGHEPTPRWVCGAGTLPTHASEL